jgi:hypothetical protein
VTAFLAVRVASETEWSWWPPLADSPRKTSRISTDDGKWKQGFYQMDPFQPGRPNINQVGIAVYNTPRKTSVDAAARVPPPNLETEPSTIRHRTANARSHRARRHTAGS